MWQVIIGKQFAASVTFDAKLIYYFLIEEKLGERSTEDKSDEKGNRLLVTFSVENGATFSKMFFEQSIVANTLADRDKDYNNMLAQLGIKDASIADVLRVGNKYYANIGYGVNSQGYTTVYPNITNSVPQATEDMAF